MDASNLKIKRLLILLGLVLSACTPSPSAVQTAIAKTQAVVTDTSTPTLIPTPTPTQWAWKVIKNVFTQEQQNDSDIWRVLPLANNLEVPDAFEMKVDMESVGANVIVLEGIKNRMEFACEEGTLGVFLRNDIVVGLAFDNNDNRPAMPIINGATICQITIRFDQYAKHIEIFQNDLLVFQLTPEEIGDFPGGVFPDGKIREVDLTSGPRSGNARSGSGHIISKVRLNELVFYAPAAVMSVLPEANNTPAYPNVTPTPFVLFQDDFSKDSGRWETYGPWKIQDGVFQIDISGPDLPHAAAFAAPAGGYNFSYEVNHMCESGGIFSAIYFRQTEMGAYFVRLFWDPPGIIFGKNDAGGKNDTNLQFKDFNLVTNNWYHLKATAIDNHFWIYINEQLVIDYIDYQTSLASGRIVLTVYGEEGEIRCRFDNVKVTEETK
jgi:hypothetical protein